MLAVIVWAFFVWAGGRAVDQELATAGTQGQLRKTFGTGLVAVNGHGPEWHRWQRVKDRRRLEATVSEQGRTIRRLQSALRHRWEDQSLEAIAYASTAYGVSYSTLKRKASCETGGTFDPYAKNPRSTASGLFQFLTSTWASTPYARYSIWDPYANALAAAWMHSKAVGRGGEWSCR